MNINRTFKSPNYDAKSIAVEFIVIHYTACDLQSTLKIFGDSERKVSSHIILAEDGQAYEAVNCWDGEVQRAWHAGKSIYNDGINTWESFNDFSIGIEIVNLNGNIYDYKEEQYQSLINIINHFKSNYKALGNPERIIGHEQIAKFRGKVDPGWNFNWGKIYNACYPGMAHPTRKPNLTAEIKEATSKLLNNLPQDKETRTKFWEVLSSTMEAASKLTQK